MPPHVTPATAAKPATAAPRPSAPGKPGFKPDEGAGGLRLLTYLKLHWLMITFCGTLLGSAGAYAAWELLASKYESYALFQVQSVPATVANQNNPTQARTDFVTYLKTTSALIKSEFVLNAALRDIKDLPTIKAQKDPIKFLDEELIVNWQDGSEVIRITFKSKEPADAKRIVDAVQAAFMREVVQKDVQEKQVFQRKVEEAMQDMRKILDRISAQKPERNALATSRSPGGIPGVPEAMPAKDVPGAMPAAPGAPAPLPPLVPEGVVAPPASGSGGPIEQASYGKLVQMDPRILVNKVAALHGELERLPLAINDGKRRLAVLQQRLDGIKDAPVSPATLEAVEKDEAVIVQALKVSQARREYEFRKNAGDPNAPGVLQLKQAWDAHEARLKEVRKEKGEAVERAKRLADAQKIAGEMDELIRFLQRQQEQFDVAKALLGRAEKQLAELPLPAAPGKGGEIQQAGAQEPVGYQPEGSYTDSADGIYRRLVQQYYLTQMELSSPTRVRVLQQGSNPTQRDMKKQIMGTAFAALMGFGVMVLGVLGFEMLTKKVSSLADVKAAGPMPVVGVIPGLPGEVEGRDPSKRAAANEAIDKLRAHVAQAWLARGATTIAVTSPLGDEGKAFAAFGLASSLAQSGYKTLLVDFDLRDPQLHDLAGVANAGGVCELLRGEADAAAVLQYLASGLHLLPAGRWSDEARKAATGDRLESLLSKLQGPYDCVVMHGHALLTAAESVEVARRCGVVLVCAQYRATTGPLLRRAAERVAAMEVPYSGVVYVGATGEEAIC